MKKMCVGLVAPVVCWCPLARGLLGGGGGGFNYTTTGGRYVAQCQWQAHTTWWVRGHHSRLPREGVLSK
jgi:hypothetical protein